MKHPTAKHAEQVMRFFTPELFVRFNSSDEDEADRANDEWEAALGEYRRHLKRIWKRLPNGAKKLAELDLHDAELLNADKAIPLIESKFKKSGPPVISLTPAVLALRQGDQIVTLIYVLAGRVSRHAPAGKWPLSKDRPHWLYDEIDLNPRHGGALMHRILVSDGRVLEIPFFSVSMHNTSLSPVARDKLARASA